MLLTVFLLFRPLNHPYTNTDVSGVQYEGVCVCNNTNEKPVSGKLVSEFSFSSTAEKVQVKGNK
jgi:hypothetical protein